MMDNNFNNLTGNNQTGSDQIRNSQMDNIQPERDGISENMFDMQRNSRSMSEPSIEDV